MKTRELDEATLKQAGRDYAREFIGPTRLNPYNPSFRPVGGRGFVLASLEGLHFEDEFKFLMAEIRGNLGPAALKDFNDAAAKAITPYDDGELAEELADRLAITPDGKAIPGKVGKVGTGRVRVGFRIDARGNPRPVLHEVRVGETAEEVIERARKNLSTREIPIIKAALNTRISNEAAIAACDAIVDRLDEGAGAAVIQIRSGAQPADPDAAVTGTLLATLVCSDPAFGSAVDANPGGRATANPITNDSSADATAAAGYFRASATNDGATPLDDHIDGEVGASGADMNLNTAAIVSGAVVSVSAWTGTHPET